jgi:hypothetical protein
MRLEKWHLQGTVSVLRILIEIPKRKFQIPEGALDVGAVRKRAFRRNNQRTEKTRRRGILKEGRYRHY